MRSIAKASPAFAIDDGHVVKSFRIGSDYININTSSDIEKAESTYQTVLAWAEDHVAE